MKMSRRTFLFGAGVFAASPVLANFLTSTQDGPRAWAPVPSAETTNAGDLVFKVDGWSPRDGGSRDDLWLTVNQSWRGAWR